mgnify:CR=1 FL=1
MNTIGERIKDRRLELSWTQDELTKRADISKGFLSDLENGKRGIGADTLLKIARALGVSLEFLMTGGGDESDQFHEVEIPASLSRLATEEELSYRVVLALLDMHQQILAHRSNKRSNVLEEFDWKKLYESVKDFL